MEISLKPVTRGNWLEALELQVGEEQKRFVPTVAVSLAKVYIKPDGDGVEYLPFAIYHGETMVGFIMHAYEEQTTMRGAHSSLSDPICIVHTDKGE